MLLKHYVIKNDQFVKKYTSTAGVCEIIMSYLFKVIKKNYVTFCLFELMY